MTDPRLKIAVFVDFDNIEIGVKTTLGGQFDIGLILEAIKERGEVVTKVAYGDWKRAGDHGRLLSQHAIRMVQRNLTPGGDKNGADINLALDALEMAFTHAHINAFVIVGGDSDFITLVEKLKQYDRKVFVVGGRQFTSLVMQRNCHEFIAYENLLGTRRTASPGGGGGGRSRSGAPSAPAAADIEKALPLVKRALKVLADREVTPQLGLLKSTLLQLDSTFSERDYGTGTFRDFIEKVAERGLVSLKQAGRSVLVELADNAVSAGVPDTLPPAPVADVVEPRRSRARPRRARRPPRTARDARDGAPVHGHHRADARGRADGGEAVCRGQSRTRAGRCTSARSASTCARSTRRLTSASSALPASSSSCAPARRKGCCGSTAIARACCASSPARSSRGRPRRPEARRPRRSRTALDAPRARGGRCRIERAPSDEALAPTSSSTTRRWWWMARSRRNAGNEALPKPAGRKRTRSRGPSQSRARRGATRAAGSAGGAVPAGCDAVRQVGCGWVG